MGREKQVLKIYLRKKQNNNLNQAFLLGFLVVLDLYFFIC